MHDAALEALVDEIRVARVGRWFGNGRAPDLEIDQREEVLLAVAIREGVGAADGAEDRTPKIDRQPLPGVRGLVAYKPDDLLGVGRVGRLSTRLCYAV